MSVVNRNPLIDTILGEMSVSQRTIVQNILDTNTVPRYTYTLFPSNLPATISPQVQLASVQVKPDTIATGILYEYSANSYYLISYDKRPICEIWQITDNSAVRTHDENLTVLELRFSLAKAQGYGGDEVLIYANAEFVHNITATDFVANIIGHADYADEVYLITSGNGTYLTGHYYYLDTTAVPTDITPSTGGDFVPLGTVYGTGTGNLAGGTGAVAGASGQNYSGITAYGVNAKAVNDYSTASGSFSTASGYNSTVSGYNSTASGDYSTASGSRSTASGSRSTASGTGSTASGFNSTASGSRSTASGSISTASGSFSTASGDYSTASGSISTASGTGSTAIGCLYLSSQNFGSYNNIENSVTFDGKYNYSYPTVHPNAYIHVGYLSNIIIRNSDQTSNITDVANIYTAYPTAHSLEDYIPSAIGEFETIAITSVNVSAYFTYSTDGTTASLTPLSNINHSLHLYQINGSLLTTETIIQFNQGMNNCPCRFNFNGTAGTSGLQIQTPGAYFLNMKDSGMYENAYTVTSGTAYTFKGQFNSTVDKVLI